MTDKELMQQALDALEEINKLSIGENAICLPAEIDGALDALRDRLAQPEQEPVFDCPRCGHCCPPQGIYYTPPQRTWVGLTDEQIRDLWSWSMTAEAERTANTQQHAFARAIEAKLKEKNT